MRKMLVSVVALIACILLLHAVVYAQSSVQPIDIYKRATAYLRHDTLMFSTVVPIDSTLLLHVSTSVGCQYFAVDSAMARTYSLVDGAQIEVGSHADHSNAMSAIGYCPEFDNHDLTQLSNTSSLSNVVRFSYIDSALIAGKYVLLAKVYHNRDLDTEFSQIFLFPPYFWYVFVFDKAGLLEYARGWQVQGKTVRNASLGPDASRLYESMVRDIAYDSLALGHFRMQAPLSFHVSNYISCPMQNGGWYMMDTVIHLLYPNLGIRDRAQLSDSLEEGDRLKDSCHRQRADALEHLSIAQDWSRVLVFESPVFVPDQDVTIVSALLYNNERRYSSIDDILWFDDDSIYYLFIFDKSGRIVHKISTPWAVN